MITIGASESEQLRDEGIAQAASTRAKILARARAVARQLASINGETDADAVAIELEVQGVDSRDLGNAAGAIFRGKGWKFIGYKKSVRLSRHANKIGIWTYQA